MGDASPPSFIQRLVAIVTDTAAILVHWGLDHKAQLVAPAGAAPVTLTDGGGAWTHGAKGQLIASTAAASCLRAVEVSAPDTDDQYELIVYTGAGGAEAEIARASFVRGGAWVMSLVLPMTSATIAAGTRLSATVATATGAGATCAVKVWY